jgi:hypothetical protein
MNTRFYRELRQELREWPRSYWIKYTLGKYKKELVQHSDKKKQMEEGT